MQIVGNKADLLTHEHNGIVPVVGIEELVTHTIRQAAIDGTIASMTLVVVCNLICHIGHVADTKLDALLQHERRANMIQIEVSRELLDVKTFVNSGDL